MNTLTHLFDWLLAASLRASLLTLAALLLQAALHRHLGARMRYALWLPVLIVLLMPVRPESQWSIEHVFQTPPPAQTIPAPITPAMESAPVVFAAAAPMPEPINWQRMLLLTWACVAAGMLLIGCLSFMLTLRRFKQSRHAASDELLATLAQIAHEMHLRHVPRVLISSSVSSPAVTGLLRPTLLLPAQFDHDFTPAEARLVLKHELMHLKRGDLPLNALMCVLMALHWFNPLLWIAFFKIRTDREAACDAQVLHDSPSDRRIAYGHALLKVETSFCPRGFSLGLVGIFQRGSALRSRIHSIATHRTPHPAMKALVTSCILLMTFFGVTRAQQPKPAESAPLIAIEMKIIKFQQATDWNFGGRLPTKEINSFPPPALLSPEELAVQLRELLRNDSTNTISYPRMVTVSGHELMVKSVVNQSFKGKDGKVADLPIGLICKFTPAVKGEVINLAIDITDSNLIDPSTGASVSEFAGEYPTVSSRTYKASHEARDGQSWVIAGWDDGKPQSKRPVLYIITPHVIDPKKGGLPADIDLTTGTNTTAEAKTESATDVIKTKLEKIIIPHIQFQGATVEECLEYLRVKSRAHDTLTADAAARGISILYKAGNPPSTAAISLDLKTIPLGEALRYVVELASLKMIVQPYAVLVGSPDDPEFAKSATETSAPNNSDKSGELVITAAANKIILPSVEFRDATLAECIDFFRIKSRELDLGKKGVNIIVKPGGDASTRITLSLKEVPLSEALRYCAELTNHKLTFDAQSFHLTPVSDEAPADKDQASSTAAPPPASVAETKAAELRKARPQQYDFNKALLGDVLRFLATDASINFISLPADNPINQRLMTFNIRSSPFEVLETLCRANGLMLVLDHERWLIRPSDDSAQIVKSYAIPQTRANIETILQDISNVLDGAETKPAADAPKPNVAFRKDQNAIIVKATRLQHTWASAYFQGLSSSAQSSHTK